MCGDVAHVFWTAGVDRCLDVTTTNRKVVRIKIPGRLWRMMQVLYRNKEQERIKKSNDKQRKRKQPAASKASAPDKKRDRSAGTSASPSPRSPPTPAAPATTTSDSASPVDSSSPNTDQRLPVETPPDKSSGGASGSTATEGESGDEDFNLDRFLHAHNDGNIGNDWLSVLLPPCVVFRGPATARHKLAAAEFYVTLSVTLSAMLSGWLSGSLLEW